MSSPTENKKGEKTKKDEEDLLSKGLESLNIKEENVKDEETEEAYSPATRKLCKWIQECKRIVVVTGAGISVSAGIPDFRSPGTGLYDNLQKYNLPYPEAVFELDFYRNNPQPFCSLAQAMWPGLQHAPTLTHSFISLLAHKQKLLRNYTQNIDGLEFLADTPAEKLVECHGHYRTSSCPSCGSQANPDAVKHSIVDLGKPPVCKNCGAFVKPDIVFFGESLPERFYQCLQGDRAAADLVLVMGTSLQVAPVSMIPSMTSTDRKALINREAVGEFAEEHPHDNLFVAGDCDERVEDLAKLLGWYDELQERHKAVVDRIRKQKSPSA